MQIRLCAAANQIYHDVRTALYITGKTLSMRMDDQEYFRSCVARERQLAHLLGHQRLEECYESAGTLWDGAQALPKWTRDWHACGPLLTRYRIPVSYRCEPGHPGSACMGSTVVHFSDHPTPDRAVMYGVVKELIFMLEHGKAVRPGSERLASVNAPASPTSAAMEP